MNCPKDSYALEFISHTFGSDGCTCGHARYHHADDLACGLSYCACDRYRQQPTQKQPGELEVAVRKAAEEICELGRQSKGCCICHKSDEVAAIISKHLSVPTTAKCAELIGCGVDDVDPQQVMHHADNCPAATEAPRVEAPPTWWCCSADYPNHDETCSQNQK